MLSIRVSEGDLATLKAAAERAGMSVTAFILTGALQLAEKEPLRQDEGGMPETFADALAYLGRVREQVLQGGAGSYFDYGKAIANCLATLRPDDTSEEDWNTTMNALRKLAAIRNSSGAIVEWICSHETGLLEGLNPRRYELLVDGFRDSLVESIDLTAGSIPRI